MALLPVTNLVFKVRRREPELVAPSKPTPHEFKYLSDIDDQATLRCHISNILVYPYNPAMEGKDPVKMIREALGDTLVLYYPFAGRLRECPNKKLVVECTGEGVIFIEADADVTLDQLSGALQPPFPCFEELLFNVPGSAGILDCPLLLVQVTRLKCGGFVFTIRVNHTMTDAFGVVRILKSMAEIARGANTSSVLPVWEREVFNARDPPCVTCIHREYEAAKGNKAIIVLDMDKISQRSFFFGPRAISALRTHIPQNLRQCSRFEILAACLWKCRTIALQPDPDQEMRMINTVNVRNKVFNSELPEGYYGNAFAFPAAVATARDLSKNPLVYALELIRKAKDCVTEEYMRSLADFMAINGRPCVTLEGSIFISDVTRVGLKEIDFGWGQVVYSGPANAVLVGSFFIPFTSKEGEIGILLPMVLPASAMDRFAKELDQMLNSYPDGEEGDRETKTIISSL